MSGRRSSLSRQLALAIAALIAITVLATTLAARQAVSFWLMRELDATVRLELTTALANPNNPVAIVRGPGSGPGTLQAVFTDQGDRGSYVSGFRAHELSEDHLSRLRAEVTRPAPHRGGHDGEHGEPQTVSLPELGDYRVLAASSGPRTVIVGESLDRVTHVVGQLTGSVMAIGLGIAVLAAGTGMWWVRRRLEPLQDVASVARGVRSEDLVHSDIEVPRAPEPSSGTSAEIADVTLALNHLLDTVELSMGQRAHTEAQLRQFIADASHELRTPLAALSGWRQLLDKGAVGQREALDHIRAESARMTELVSDLLTLARLDAPQTGPGGPADIVPIVLDVASSARAADGGHPLSIRIDESVAAGADIALDPESLTRLVANLVTNARIHTPPGTAIDVELAAAGTDVVMTVADHGPGVPGELAERIFDRFVRAETSRTRASGGSTGLGLAIAKAAALEAGGSIDLTESPGGGATFTVRLPRVTS